MDRARRPVLHIGWPWLEGPRVEVNVHVNVNVNNLGISEQARR